MKLQISGIDGYDGDYEFEFSEFTQGELAEMEAVAKVPFSKFEDGYISVVVALSAAVLKRAGKPVVIDMLWAAKPGALMVGKGDADPPAVTPSPTRSSGGEQTSSESSATGSGSES